jgi:hypothetical protein
MKRINAAALVLAAAVTAGAVSGCGRLRGQQAPSADGTASQSSAAVQSGPPQQANVDETVNALIDTLKDLGATMDSLDELEEEDLIVP